MHLRTVKARTPVKKLMVKMELDGNTKTHIVEPGQTMNNNCHVNHVPILLLIINYNSCYGNYTN